MLRGPQPTLTNASAGAILIRSARPTDEFEAFLTSSFGNYDLREFRGALNVPLVPGWLAFRGAFKMRDHLVVDQTSVANPGVSELNPVECQ